MTTSSPKKSIWQNLREIVYGMATHDMSRYAVRTRASSGRAAARPGRSGDPGHHPQV